MTRPRVVGDLTNDAGSGCGAAIPGERGKL